MMTRITPRTCLWPLTISLILTFALSIGLTFQSDHHCYAATCGLYLSIFETGLSLTGPQENGCFPSRPDCMWYCGTSGSHSL